MLHGRSFFQLGIGAAAVAGILLASAACTVKTASNVDCGGEKRPSVDCSSEVSYQGYKADGGFGIMNLASGAAKFEETALRRITEATERFITVQTRLCRDYNACALDKSEYNTESKDIRDKLEKIPVLVEKVKSAPSADDRVEALDSLYRHTVPSEERVEEVALRLALEADLPPDAGGQRITVRPGAPLPTEARVWFWVEVMPKAYVYIFQKSAKGEVSVLFPDERMSTTNPLAGETKVRIPNGDLKFRVNDKDIGIEHIYFAASRTPLSSLDQALARVREGKTTTIGQDKLLAGFESLPTTGSVDRKCRGLELDSAPSTGGCTRTRGLVLDVSSGFGEGASIGAVTEPGDGLIVYNFTFEHTTLAAYGDAAKRYTSQPSKTRGGLIIERDSGKPKTRGGLIIEKDGGDPKKPKTRGGLIIE
jgi:hypothetical protein